MNKEFNKLPLEGIIILDLTNVLSGPFATLILKDLGAKIIKVEKPGGDDSRKFGPFLNNKSCYFISLNRGKKSISLDLKIKEDKLIFKKLLSKTDVLIDNFRPGVLERLGFSWNYLSKTFPKLIHSKISGFGETGPLKKSPAYDIIVQAMGGLMGITGDNKNSYRVGTSIGDIAASLFCVIGILSQLIRRNRLNLGSKLDLSMLDCQVSILENAITRFSAENKNPTPLGTDHPSITPFGCFKTKNIPIVIAIGNDKLFKKFCEVIGDKKIPHENMFVSNKNRNINLTHLRKRIEKKLVKKGSVYWLKTLSKNGIPCSKINKISDVINNPQIINRGMILNYSDKDVKNLKISDTPFKFNFYKSHKKKDIAPDLNENKKEILKMLLD